MTSAVRKRTWVVMAGVLSLGLGSLALADEQSRVEKIAAGKGDPLFLEMLFGRARTRLESVKQKLLAGKAINEGDKRAFAVLPPLLRLGLLENAPGVQIKQRLWGGGTEVSYTPEAAALVETVMRPGTARLRRNGDRGENLLWLSGKEMKQMAAVIARTRNFSVDAATPYDTGKMKAEGFRSCTNCTNWIAKSPRQDRAGAEPALRAEYRGPRPSLRYGVTLRKVATLPAKAAAH